MLRPRTEAGRHDDWDRVPIAMGARWPSGANSAFPASGEISPVRRECPRVVLPLAAMTADLSRLPIRAWCSGPQPQGAARRWSTDLVPPPARLSAFAHCTIPPDRGSPEFGSNPSQVLRKAQLGTRLVMDPFSLLLASLLLGITLFAASRAAGRAGTGSSGRNTGASALIRTTMSSSLSSPSPT